MPDSIPGQSPNEEYLAETKTQDESDDIQRTETLQQQELEQIEMLKTVEIKALFKKFLGSDKVDIPLANEGIVDNKELTVEQQWDLLMLEADEIEEVGGRIGKEWLDKRDKLLGSLDMDTMRKQSAARKGALQRLFFWQAENAILGAVSEEQSKDIFNHQFGDRDKQLWREYTLLKVIYDRIYYAKFAQSYMDVDENNPWQMKARASSKPDNFFGIPAMDYRHREEMSRVFLETEQEISLDDLIGRVDEEKIISMLRAMSGIASHIENYFRKKYCGGHKLISFRGATYDYLGEESRRMIDLAQAIPHLSIRQEQG